MAHDDTLHSAGPIWLAALVATGCQAVSDRECHPIGWHWVAGRAVYTNVAAPAEEIQPLGVTIAQGETLAVTWEPGETAYTLYVDPPEALCA
jgi:hypothetical protein